MKILFVASANSGHSYKWVKYFAERDYEVVWVSLTPYTEKKIENIVFYQLKGSFLSKFLELKKIIKKTKPDILHSHYAGFNGLIGALTKFHPFIITAWGDDIFFVGKSMIKGQFVKYALKRADIITCNGKPLAKGIKEMGIDSSKIVFIYWATDVERFKPFPKDMKLKKELKLFDFPTIISIRSLEPVYDVRTLIRAFPIILKNFPTVKLIIGGKGSQKENLEKIAKKLNVFESIRFTDMISHDDIPRFLNSSDIYVSTSLSDGDLSQSTQQAMACELPVITTDIEVNKDRIENGKNGFIVPIKSSELLAEKIILLLKDEKLRNDVGKQGRKTIKDSLNFYKEMKNAENLYFKLFNNYKR